MIVLDVLRCKVASFVCSLYFETEVLCLISLIRAAPDSDSKMAGSIKYPLCPVVNPHRSKLQDGVDVLVGMNSLSSKSVEMQYSSTLL